MHNNKSTVIFSDAISVAYLAPGGKNTAACSRRTASRISNNQKNLAQLFYSTRHVGPQPENDSPSTTANGLTETTNLYCSSFEVQATPLDPIGHSSSQQHSACAIYYDDDRSMRAQQTKRGGRERRRRTDAPERGELRQEERVLPERHERELVEDTVPRAHGDDRGGGDDHLHPSAPPDARAAAPRDLPRRRATRRVPPSPVQTQSRPCARRCPRVRCDPPRACGRQHQRLPPPQRQRQCWAQRRSVGSERRGGAEQQRAVPRRGWAARDGGRRHRWRGRGVGGRSRDGTACLRGGMAQSLLVFYMRWW